MLSQLKPEKQHEVRMERVSINDAILRISERLRETPQMAFTSIFEGLVERHRLIAAFLGLLEMVRLKLVRVTQEALWIGIAQVRPGARLGDIGHAIQRHAESHGYSVVREYCGHGIGREFHEDPQVLHYGEPGTGLELRPGMCFTIEPMINAGKRHVKLLADGWTVVTKDRSLSAQWEHTLLVTETGGEVLTLRQEEVVLARQRQAAG